MPRSWTEQQVAAFRKARDDSRQKLGLPRFESLTEEEKKIALVQEHDELRQREETAMKMTAWPLEKYAPHPFWAPRAGVLQCPEEYGGAGGCYNLKFSEGADLNMLVYRHYASAAADQLMDDLEATNFVVHDGVRSARHELVGPRPHVAGYRVRKGIAEILFWDEHLQKAWVGSSCWRQELEFDEEAEAWFVDKMKMWEW
ncbi:hypothetical protein BDZ89DRAFT_1167686 [Hymenopellis radicata]|nr:hypothetical protein BDZ89DRAFT_1167686 [Hymenopellis radicata]